MKIAIVMTYYERSEQLIKTLHSIEKTKHTDFEVIIVDDASPNDIKLPSLSYDVTIIKLANKTWNGTSSVYNTGFLKAIEHNAEVVIIQNAECYHSGDILTAANEVTDKNYIALSCYSLAKGEDPIVTNDRGAVFNGESAWYNHPVYRPLAYHFCSAITTRNLKKINGFDERFSAGIAYEDDFLVHQIKNLGLRIDIPLSPLVFHQYHYDGMNRDVELVKKNAELFNELKKETGYRGTHLLTPDL